MARVALPRPVDRLYDYAVPAQLESAARVGSRVRVSAGGQALNGVIVERDPADQATQQNAEGAPEQLKALGAVLDAEPVINETLLKVLRDEADAVLCPLGIALQAALPPGYSAQVEPGFQLTERGARALSASVTSASAQRALAALQKGPRGLRALKRQASEALLDELEKDGLVQRCNLENEPSPREATLRIARLAPGIDVEKSCAEDLARAPKQAALLRAIKEQGECPVQALAEAHAPGPQERNAAYRALRSLEQRGLVQIIERAGELEDALPETQGEQPPKLSDEQAEACSAIGAAVRARRSENFLLHGVTGSGKTEVYLRAVAEALEIGRQALVLVPEITLTHQILGRLRARFGNRLAVLHSGLSQGERLSQWKRLRREKTPIVVGARSALFAPTHDLGVIVVDEEHDGAYKSEEGFRYHARSLAQRRSRADGCPLVLGSATPAVETRYAAERGRVHHLRLTRRVSSRPLPSVEVVDLASLRAALPRGRALILSPQLLAALGKTLKAGAQAILFLNRRGFSTQITCFACGHVSHCQNCDIALTFHAGEHLLRCHYCGYEGKPPELCPKCNEPDWSLLGIGTERVEEEVRKAFPAARIARLDRDTARKANTVGKVLRGLQSGELDVLVGTQMVAKGHDFPGVRLVGVINGDLGLHVPDFRAAERTFQLLTQVAGRAGRASGPGRVVLQTWSPGHYAIEPVVAHDYERFYAEEIGYRSALAYPPFQRVGLVRVSAEQETDARLGAEALAAAIRQQADALNGELLGPAPAPIARLRGRYRFQVLVRHREWSGVCKMLKTAQAAAARQGGELRSSVDPNPYDML